MTLVADSDPKERLHAGTGTDEGYFTGRMLASVARAAASADSLAKLAHYELAGRYSLAALAAGRQRSLGRLRR